MIYPEAGEITDYLRGRAAESARRHYTQVVSSHKLMLQHDFWPGVFSVTYPRLRERIIFADTAVAFGEAPSGKDWWAEFPRRESGPFDTPSRCAREYLAHYYKPARWTTAQDAVLMQIKMPKYWYPHPLEEACYVDIKAAWRSIMMVLGWDVAFWPGEFFSPGRPPYDYPLLFSKTCYPLLVSCCTARRARFHEGGKGLRMVKAYNQNYNRQLFAAIAEVLRSIAFQCLRDGAIYWNVDGCICHSKDLIKITNNIRGWGLDCTIKRGPCPGFVGAGHYYFADGKQAGARKFVESPALAPDWRDLSSWMMRRWDWARDWQSRQPWARELSR